MLVSTHCNATVALLRIAFVTSNGAASSEIASAAKTCLSVVREAILSVAVAGALLLSAPRMGSDREQAANIVTCVNMATDEMRATTTTAITNVDKDPTL